MVKRLNVLRFDRRLALGAALLAVGAAGASAATTHTVKLNLQGGFANHTLTACGNSHHYTYFHRGRRVPFNGSVTPSPPKPWRVKIKVKKCVRGQFVTVVQTHASGDSRGHFRGTVRGLRRGLFFARAYYYGDRPASQSDKQYFRIR